MLFDPARHEPLRDAAWDEARARQAIAAIVADTEAALRDDGTWPWHPLDTKRPTQPGHKTLYMGAAGVLWALWHLERQGAARLRIDPRALIAGAHGAYLAAPDTGEVVPSYFLGEVGLLLVLWRLTQSADAAEQLYTAIERNIPNPVNEALWAAPGTMVGALHMLEWTGERRWVALFQRNVEQLWNGWLPSDHARCRLWTQDLYGEVVQLLGAGHGFAGNAYPLLRGAKLLPRERRELLYDRVLETLAATALVDGDCANWPPGVGAPREGREQSLVQWCHGAPGIVTATADYPVGHAAAMDALLLRAANLTWHAGPLEKGFGICHGTAGNGYAFLQLHARTRDAAWLEKARAFAMHSIGQYERMRARHGRGRYTLWTGDPGLAVYLWQCIRGEGGVPSLDFL